MLKNGVQMVYMFKKNWCTCFKKIGFDHNAHFSLRTCFFSLIAKFDNYCLVSSVKLKSELLENQ